MALKIVPLSPSEERKTLLTSIRSFPMLGISLNGIRHFISECGGKDQFLRPEILKTEDACQKFVKPWTLSLNVSYCEFLQRNSATEIFVGQANVFISHAWMYSFINVVDVLVRYGSNKKAKEKLNLSNTETFYWFDLFSNNQHLNDPPPFEWWCETFMNAVQNIGRVIMVMEPWDNPITLTRAWCLWEIFCSKRTNSIFEVAMGEEESAAFCQQVMNNPTVFYDMLRNVDIRRSQARSIVDRDRIFDAVTTAVGCYQLNVMVMECLRKWVIETIQENVWSIEDEIKKADESNSNTRQMQATRIQFLIVLGHIYQMQGSYDEALQILQSSRDAASQFFGTSVEWIHAGNAIAECMINKTRGVRELSFTQAAYGGFQANKVLDMIVEQSKVSTQAYGPDHELTLTSNRNMAMYMNLVIIPLVPVQTKVLNMAEEMLRNCLKKRQERWGERHPLTLASTFDLAEFYVIKYKPIFYQNKAQRWRQLQEANQLLTFYVTAMTEVDANGADHPECLRAQGMLGQVAFEMGNELLGAGIINECISKYREKVGEEHPRALALMVMLSSYHYKHGKYEDAETVLTECIRLRKKTQLIEPNLVAQMDLELMDLKTRLKNAQYHRGKYVSSIVSLNAEIYLNQQRRRDDTLSKYIACTQGCWDYYYCCRMSCAMCCFIPVSACCALCYLDPAYVDSNITAVVRFVDCLIGIPGCGLCCGITCAMSIPICCGSCFCPRTFQKVLKPIVTDLYGESVTTSIFKT